MSTLPTIDLCGHAISRLIFGGNPVAGFSHTSVEMDEEMQNYYTTENVKKAVRHCLEVGINTIQFRGDAFSFRLIREMRNEGMQFNWIAQSAPEMLSFESGIAKIAAMKPTAIYMQGCDPFFMEGKTDIIRDRLKVIRDTGYPVGLGTHLPEQVAFAEEHGWDVDFYETCVYNMMVPSLEARRFDHADCALMYNVIRQTKKPCMAFKILAASRRCGSEEALREAFTEAFTNIKPTDAVVVGMLQKHKDQVAQNAGIVRDILSKPL
nr:hypothetical protein [bacterium]